MEELIDSYGRKHDYLRVSLIERCNLRCTYCMPKQVFNSQYQFLVRDDLLSFEEITRLASLFADQGVRKLRLTGVNLY